MDVKVFKTFLEVANTRHFGRAADNLYITQAAVSARIKQLEEFVNAPLFVRLKNNITLTPAGERLLPYATTMVRALQQVKSEISLIDAKLMPFSIAATPNVWDAYFQNYLTVAANAFDELAFKTEMLGIRQLHASIIDNTLDLALMFDPFLTNEVCSEQIAQINLSLVSSEPNVSAEQAMSKGYIFVDWGAQFASEHEAKYGRNFVPKLKTSTGRIALDFLLAQGGSAYLPNALAEPFIESGELHRVKGKHAMKRSIYAVYQKHNRNVDIVEQVVEVIDQSSPQRPAILEMASNVE
nr:MULTISPECIES: LysR family transcriptional regulator [unclassified Psychrosphaera]